MYVIMASVIGPYLLRVSWLVGLANSLLLLLLITASFAGKAQVGKVRRAPGSLRATALCRPTTVWLIAA